MFSVPTPISSKIDFCTFCLFCVCMSFSRSRSPAPFFAGFFLMCRTHSLYLNVFYLQIFLLSLKLNQHTHSLTRKSSTFFYHRNNIFFYVLGSILVTHIFHLNPGKNQNEEREMVKWEITSGIYLCIFSAAAASSSSILFVSIGNFFRFFHNICVRVRACVHVCVSVFPLLSLALTSH